MRRTSQLIIALVAFATGCSDNPTGPTQNALESARRIWVTNGFPSYQFTIQMDCFCAVNGPIRATVVNDSVTTAVLIATGQSVDPRWVKSINKLFDFVGQGIANNAVVLQVTYNPTLGYPSKIVYDGATNIADDEVTYTVSDVQSAASSSSRP